MQQRFSVQYIYRELDLIPHMNSHLEFPLLTLNKVDLLQHLKPPELISLVDCLPFLKRKEHPLSREVRVRIEYENAGRLLLVTGIQKDYMEAILLQFNNSTRYGKGPHGKIHHYNSFWICVETASEDAANMLKKYLRNEKRNMDESNRKYLYKMDKRRVRIIIAKEDLFTLLVDAMTEAKYS